ncbi:unnamed protein product [Didymodactylos carnosus]|nr:unnamed protein product [Didymodactylos carnosus]CAF3865584.1 unnamed protein product [Didymodactylos carnosus]
MVLSCQGQMDQLKVEDSFGTVTLSEKKVHNFVGIWFYDDSIDPKEISQMENCLNKIFDYSKMFNDPAELIAYIYSNRISKFVFIISSRLTEYLTRIAVKREEFLTIYFHCLTNINDYQIYCQYSKVNQNLFDNMNDLLTKALIEILMRLEHKDDAKQDMVNECRARDIDKQICFDKIKEFEECCRSHEAIVRYTLNTVFFRLLNQAFRTENIQRIYPFRLMITDIQRQLRIEYMKAEKKPIEKAYRGRMLPVNTLYRLIDNQNDLISMNGVLSATRSESVALMFAGEGCIRPGYESVVFELDLSTINICTKPLADIAHLSKIKDGFEVLFSSVTIWHIESVSHDDSNVKIKLKLGSDNDFESIHLMNQLKNRLNNESACTFMTLEYLKIAEQCFSLSNSQQVLTIIRTNQYAINCKKNLVNSSKDEFMLKSLPGNQISKLKVYINMDYTYQTNYNNEKALEYYQKVFDSEENEINPLDLSVVYNNIEQIQFTNGYYDKAIESYTKALKLGFRSVPDTHPWIIDYKKNIRTVYRYMRNKCNEQKFMSN